MRMSAIAPMPHAIGMQRPEARRARSLSHTFALAPSLLPLPSLSGAWAAAGRRPPTGIDLLPEM